MKRMVMIGGALLIASFLATEVFAWTRGWHPWLGQPLFHAGMWPVYYPLDIWRWAWAWVWKSPEAFRSAGIVFGLVFSGLLAATLWPKPTGKPQAQWATRRTL